MPRSLALRPGIIIALSVLALAWPPVRTAAGQPRAAAPASVMYTAGGHLWTVPTTGGTPTRINTPWRMAKSPDTPQLIEWSPDHNRVAVDDGRSRLAVINIASGHATVLISARCAAKFCNTEPLATWSPNSRYLAILQPVGNGQSSRLSVWDSAAGKTRSLLKAVTGYVSGAVWSHDSTRIAVSTGPFNQFKDIYPSLTIVTVGGKARTLGKGIAYDWSPDDRFIGGVRSHTCGANTCDDAEIIQSTSGGKAVVLVNHMDSNFEDPYWAKAAPLPGTSFRYGFDRWALGAGGHIARREAGNGERADGWSPDGNYVAVETYHPYEETPDALYISTPQGERMHLYTAGKKDSCGACSKDVYQVTWASCTSGLLALSTPEYPTPKMVTVYPKIYVSNVRSAPPPPPGGGPVPVEQVPVRGTTFTSAIGFVDHDTALVVRSGHALYRYAFGPDKLTKIATGVTDVADPALESTPCS